MAAPPTTTTPARSDDNLQTDISALLESWGFEKYIAIFLVKTFPSENSAVYYTSSRGPGQAHGRLFDAVTNLKAKYRRNQIYEPRARRSLNKTLTPEAANFRPALNKEDLILAPNSGHECDKYEVEESLEWLKSSVDNYNLCLEKWQKTSEIRLQRVLTEKEVQTYISDFPCLRRSWGLTLLIEDFNKWYPGNESIFQNKFPLLKNKLVTISEKITGKSTFVATLKKNCQDADPETSALGILMLIPYILGPIHIKKKKTSAKEVRESFILHIEDEKQLNEKCNERRERYKAMGITVQPYIIVAGSLEKITSRYVVLDDIIYAITCIGDAVDACFKIIWALYLEYPSECLHVWQFVQRAIYNIPSKAVDKRERVTPAVLGLLSDCGVSTN